jgi:hypothetical protein
LRPAPMASSASGHGLLAPRESMALRRAPASRLSWIEHWSGGPL